MATLNVNGKPMAFDAEPDTPLLWVLREQLGLTGTKYGCGIAQCGSCTVHIDGAPVRSCVRAAGGAEAEPEDRHHRGPVAPTARTRCRRPGRRWTCRSAASARAA